MHAMWISLKESFNCGSKLTDVIISQRTSLRSCTGEKNLEGDRVHPKGRPMREVIFQKTYTRNLYHELDISNSSRNVVKLIFQAAASHPSKHSRKIKKVLRVNNSEETLEKFEKYREMVKNKSYKQHKRHPRIIVDGNEILQFYGTTMNCCRRKLSKVSELCNDPACRVCRLIQSGFNTAYNRRNGIQLSTSSEEFSEDKNTIAKEACVKKATIVCRTIAGTVVNMFDGEYEEEYDSVGSGRNTKAEYLFVRDPSAVLPCFVIIFD
ncbi:unnamed protein product [Ilex paraguariensis]|uniref:Uncharacterized protein n=1 Tax=Ilex paraguariensis TaxID=185542 RepID=A0ABC8RVA7_9AQUA